MVSGIDHLSNVTFLKRHKCYWGDFGHVRATLEGIAYLFNNEIEFDYLILLTGQDYPIKSNREIETFLRKSNGKQFMTYDSLPHEGWQEEDGGFASIENWQFRIHNTYIRVPLDIKSDSVIKSILSQILSIIFHKRTFLKNMIPFTGSSYWCITRELAKHIAEFVNNNQKFVQFFERVFGPDDLIFATLIMNSRFKGNVINDNLRCIRWLGGPHPHIWITEDFPILAKSRALFARKFDAAVDTEILDLIDSKLLRSS
jgi:hypothetical protein